MPLAVTHVLLTIILVDLFRDYIMKKHKKYLTLHTLMIAGVAGLLPDIDIPINWILGFFGKSFEIMQHGGITHTSVFGLIFLIPAFILWASLKIPKKFLGHKKLLRNFLVNKKRKISVYFFVITFGVLFHIFLDYLLGGGGYEGIMWLWPLSTQAFKLHLLKGLGMNNLSAGIDAVLLLGWLWHEEIKHKISDFI